MSYTVAVRALCEFTARAGDLDLRFTPAPSALEGIEGHGLVRARRGAGYEAELRLAGSFEDLQVRGRADGFDPGLGQLEEIKTYRGQIDSVRDNHRALHWAQAKVYGHLLCLERGLPRLKVALVYFNVGTQQETVLAEPYSAAELQAFFEQQCRLFLDWARSEAAHRSARDAAMVALRFPFAQFRTGQRALSVAVYRTAQAGLQAGGGSCLMAQAPTGIGKTVATIFPMLKASAQEGLDKLFFLTAKTTGHRLALHALGLLQTALQGQTGAVPLRVVDLQARDKSCEHPDKACHGESCPLAQGFYDRLSAARAQALAQEPMLTPDKVRTLALRHQVCPYYLTQELARWSDVVVGDYHYFYDSAAMLYALTQAHQWKVGVLVDEAHNLLERARRMYTAELPQHTLAAARKAAAGPVKKSLDALNRQWNALNKAQHEGGQDYQVYAELPPGLLGAVQRAVAAIAQAQGDSPMLPGDAVLGFYLEALSWLNLAEQLGPHALFDISLWGSASAGRRGPMSTLCIRNVVPAPHLAARHSAACATVLFSGTLGPQAFYQDLLGLPPATQWVDVPSPFLAAQLQVQIAGHISTRYQDRAQSLVPIAEVVAAQFARQPGNYLCFFSSFDYLQRAADCMQRLHPQLPLFCQTSAMDDAGRAAFLARFDEAGQGIGLAVLGGAFSEGVDLPGNRLIGAFIATLGLPQVNPINTHMQQAMAQRFGTAKAYDYTYLYPGLRKVVQAAGRVIRSEDDRGVVVLIDDRFHRAQVRALLPSWWEPQRW